MTCCFNDIAPPVTGAPWRGLHARRTSHDPRSRPTVDIDPVDSTDCPLKRAILERPVLGCVDAPPGVDLRERLGVTKYEPAMPETREIAGPFPARVPKTDEIRLQSALGVLDEIRGLPFYVSTKCDGSSATYLREATGLVACSRNWALHPGNNPVWNLAARYRLAEVLPVDVAVQGEVCGPGIQKNRLALAGLELFVLRYDSTSQRGRRSASTESLECSSWMQ